MPSGIVDWFDAETRQGFILRDELGKRPVYIPSYVVKKAGITPGQLTPGLAVSFSVKTFRTTGFSVADDLRLTPDTSLTETEI